MVYQSIGEITKTLLTQAQAALRPFAPDIGCPADRVLFDVEGSSTDPVLIGTSSTFDGTLIAPARDCLVNAGATINGQLVCGGNVTVGGNLTAKYIPMIEIPWD